MRTGIVKRWVVGGALAVGVAAAFVLAVVVGMFLGGGSYVAGDTAVAVPTAMPAAAVSPTPGSTPDRVATGETALPTPLPTPTAPLPRTGAKPAIALFVGDSYTAGQRASTPDARWSSLVAGTMHWTERNVADGGTGFVTRYPGRGLLSYAEQLRSVKYPKRIDVVVIAGGQNDFDELRTEPGTVFRAVDETYALAARRFPDARIIAVGPSTPWAVGLEARALDSAVRAAAERYGATYVSLIDPNVVRRDHLDADGIHVTDEGYAAIARRVVTQIS
ncbi:SGNH/GDSL hydrolase family protein [Promicromonospora thailandica]|uniref:SGNH/GDSL hydrolase family protein n=1 Tax=Promicromonospora thailandica TaxID=765201 RepID=UPI0020A2765C|nr:SGNH/GDSL hydrolase family protein [Promicromonospora thailandica]